MGYESSGGVGGIEFSFEELSRSAGLLGKAGLDLHEGAASLLHSPEIPLALLGIATVLQRYRLLAIGAELGSIVGLCTARALECDALSLKVTISRNVYEYTEAEVTRRIELARGAFLPVNIMWDLVSKGGKPRGKTMEDIINQAPNMAGVLSGMPLGFLGDREHGGVFDTSVAQRLYPLLSKGLDGAGLVELGTVELAAANSTSTLHLNQGIDTLLELQNIAELEPPGSILVSTVQAKSGPVHIVTIPGTQTAELNAKQNVQRIADPVPQGMVAENPWEFAGISESMGFGSQHVSVAVSQALSAAGAQPGDQIILSGYSQGGIHAMNLAADTRITDTYQVDYVLTAGSPVALISIPESATALHLEDREDMVPGTDGSENPAHRNRTTVYFDQPNPNLDLTSDGFGRAHKLENYRDHARELAGTTDPSIAESAATLSMLLGGAGTLRVKSYQLRRVIKAKPKPKQKPKVKGWPMKEPHPGIHPITSGWG